MIRILRILRGREKTDVGGNGHCPYPVEQLREHIGELIEIGYSRDGTSELHTGRLSSVSPTGIMLGDPLSCYQLFWHADFNPYGRLAIAEVRVNGDFPYNRTDLGYDREAALAAGRARDSDAPSGHIGALVK